MEKEAKKLKERTEEAKRKQKELMKRETPVKAELIKKETPVKAEGEAQKDQTTSSKYDPDSTTPGTHRNQYHRSSGGAHGPRAQDAGGSGGGGGDDSSDSSDEGGNTSDEGGNNGDGDRSSRDGSEDEEETYSGNGNGNTEEPVDEQGVDARGNTTRRNIVKNRFVQAEYITPKCLQGRRISGAMSYFATKEALTRNDLPNVNGAHGNSKKKPQYSLRVAPWFEKKYKEIMKDIGMPDAADDEMTEWYGAWRESRKDGEWLDDDTRLQISNGYNQLVETKFTQMKNLLEGAPQLKSKASAKKLTPQDVKKWMRKGRVYCLKRAIYWKTFHNFMITSHTLHPEIKEAIDARLSAKTFSSEGAWTISVYIEKIILDMLEPEENFNDMKDRLVEKHVRILQKDESTTQLRAELEEDALQLTYVDPSFIKAKKQGKGVMNDMIRKDKMEGNRHRLLVSILKAANYYVDLEEMYSYRSPSVEVEEVDERDVILDLTKLMKTQKARKMEDAESRVYSTQPKKTNALEKALQLRIAMLEQQQNQLVHQLKGQPGAATGPGTSRPTKDVGLDIPYSEFKYPCHKCESKPGTDQEKKDLCTTSQHCRNHNGEYRCTKSRTCRNRTEKEKTLMAFKKATIPEKATKATVNQIMTYTDEDLEHITAFRPCNRGEPCPQQTGGIHSKLCRVEMAKIESLLGQGPDPDKLARELIEEQEQYNQDPMNGFEAYQTRHSYDYDYCQGQEDKWRTEGPNY
jgi:hypothetical protein